MSEVKAENFVTVVAVGTGEQETNNENINFDSNSPGYVTVLTIGDTENNKVLKDVTEEVIVYRLPGERLGFGLKFEGGTKASEFVKRLFIQSCAADSPASRVKSSWGKLTEGDEVLEIDSVSVNTMTRIDCVRCLKDSNVAIKLLVRHIYENRSPKNKPEEELPSIVTAEEKKTPPPPVPPRKIPRKMLKTVNASVSKDTQETTQENNVPAPRQPEAAPPVPANVKTKKLQSPRSSVRSYYSPDVHRKDRRFSDGSLGPPDPEVYVDLFLQESTQSLSESDETGSTISTVIDRFGSFPTTTTSSFAGSLPTTPSVQKKLDISNIAIYDDEEILTINRNIGKTLNHNKEENNNIILDESNPLCFQDAPLSYGNENTKIIVPEEVDGQKEEPIVVEENKQFVKKPPVPPRSRDTVLSTEKCDTTKKNDKCENLPRLVDFLPKSSNGINESVENNSAEIMKLFLENERYKTNVIDYDISENDNIDTYSNGIDLFSSKWNLSSQLATIGEVEEEGGSSDFSFNRTPVTATPVVIVENADSNENDKQQNQSSGLSNNKESHGIMETLPSDSRQPPDGHEFPDFIEDTTETIKQSTQKYFKDSEKEPTFTSFVTMYQKPIQNNVMEDFPKTSNLIITQNVSASNNDLRPKTMYDSSEDLQNNETVPEPTPLHSRSQSLIDMSTLSKQKNAKWNQLIEQRRKGLSKLKGLVIPESSESDVAPIANPPINIPEIRSHKTATFVPVPKLDNSFSVQSLSTNNSDTSKATIVIPPWSPSVPNNLPKYSPAFKRKSLQVYTTNLTKNENHDSVTNTEFLKYCDKSSPNVNRGSDDDLNPPKSLESISSPTRSDCSFDFVSSTTKKYRENNDSLQKTANKAEDESDNDSAVSSSQSSYNSRFSPPPSPTRSCEDDYRNQQNRLLKPSSVEAINRKNILASAKCRSGKDLKIGSPVIKRKTEEPEPIEQPPSNDISKDEITDVPVKTVTKAWGKISPLAASVIVPNESTKKEAVKTPTKVEIVKETPLRISPKSAFVPIMSPVTTSRSTEDVRESRFTSRELYSSSNILSRKPKPINVKALKQNFENFGSSAPPMPQKVPIYKSQITTISRNVKADIARAETEIATNAVVLRKSERSVIKPKEIKARRSLELRKDVVDKIIRSSSSTIKLTLDSVGTSLGITLAGGVDEDKEITVHRIRYGSLAYHDGRLRRGDKIISVNGNTTKGLTHAEATELLKAPVTAFVFEVEEGIETVSSASSTLSRRSSSISTLSEPKTPVDLPVRTPTNVITFVKDGAGLGFSIEGGKDSPIGDVPLLVKKIFTGGAADKNGELKMGDQIIMINDIGFTNLTRIEAWNLMKKIPDGAVNIHVFR